MFEVVEYFIDLKDGGHHYNVGDAFPRAGKEVSDARIKELSTTKNKRGIVLIKEVVTSPKDVEIPKKGTKNGSSKTAKK